MLMMTTFLVQLRIHCGHAIGQDGVRLQVVHTMLVDSVCLLRNGQSRSGRR